MNRSTFLTSLFALPAAVKALMNSSYADDIIVPDTGLNDIRGGDICIDGERVATLDEFELGDIEDPTPYLIVEEFDEPPFFRVFDTGNLKPDERASLKMSENGTWIVDHVENIFET